MSAGGTGVPGRILMTTDTVGGVWTYTLELARGLSAHGVEVALATMGAALTPAQSAEARCLPRLDIYESQFKLEWMPDPWEEVADAGAWLLGLERRLNPELVHLNSYAYGNLPWRVPTLIVGHSCVLSWWQAVRGEPAPPEWDHYRKIVSQGLAAASLVVAPSHAMLRALARHYGRFQAGPVVYHGRTAAPAAGAKEPCLLAVGRLWDEAKSIAALDEAAPGLSWPVYVAGEMRHPAGGMMHTAHAHALGQLTSAELADWYARAMIYALPAKYEPFGLSVLEAAQAGCALVLGDLPSLREIWGPAARYVPPANADALLGALQELVEDEALCARLGRQAQTRAQEFTPERMTQGYLELYRRLLARDTVPRVRREEPLRRAA